MFCDRKERFKHRADFHGLKKHGQYIKCCDGIFLLRSTYRSHVQLFHDTNNIPSVYHCDICDKGFASEDSLKGHLNVHKNLSVRCELCDKVFKAPRYLREHTRKLHTDVGSKKELAEKTVEKYICDHCNKTFNTKNSISYHIRSIHIQNCKEELYKCDICLHTFKFKKVMLNHMILLHGANPVWKNRHGSNNENDGKDVSVYQCRICREKFASEEFLRKHQEKQASLKCVECNSVFCNPKTLFMHKNEVHDICEDENFLVCKDCSKIVSKKALHHHRTIFHRDPKSKDEERIECNMCGKSFRTKRILAIHMEIHGDEPKHQCTSCDKKFFVERYLSDHIRKYHREVKFPCTICGIILYTQPRLESHIKMHMAKMQSTVCPFCDKDFKTQISVKLHISRVHLKLNQRSWDCRVCDRKFVLKKQLSAHIRENHPMETVFTCEICGKNIKKAKGALEEHMNIHLGIKDYECDVCEMRFRTKQRLTLHKQKHSDKSNYACNECGKSFKGYQNFFLHKRRHKGIKPHKCTMCDMRFFQPYMLKTHMVYHTGEKNYHCISCNLSYYSPRDLKKHNNRHHNDSHPDPEDAVEFPENGQQC